MIIKKKLGRKDKAFLNFISQILYQLFSFAYGLIIPRMIILQYGSEMNGVATSISQFMGYFSLITAGLAQAGAYALYKPLAEKNINEINKVLSTIGLEYRRSGFILVGLCLLFSIIYPHYVSVTCLKEYELILLILVISSYGLIEMFSVAKASCLIAAEQKAFIGTSIQIVVKIIDFILIYLFIKLQYNYIFVKVSTMIALIVRAILFNYVIKKYYSYVNYKTKNEYNVLPQRFSALYLQILGLIQNSTAIILLTFIVKDLKEVSVYTIYNSILGSLGALVGFVLNAVNPAFGNIIALGDENQIKKSYILYEYFFLILISVAFPVIYIVFVPFIELYLGNVADVNYVRPLTAFLFVLNAFLYNIKNPAGAMVMTAGHFKNTRIQTTIQGLIVIIISLLLVKPYGIVGCLIGLIISNVYRTIDLLIYTPKKIVKTNIKSSFYNAFYSCLSFIIVILPFFYYKYHSCNYFQWIIQTILVLIWSLTINLLVNLIFSKQLLIEIFKFFKVKK